MARASKVFARFHVRKIYSVAITVATRRESVFVLCQVYWCYTDQPYCIYLREGFIDNLLIGGVNSVAVNFVNPISVVRILTTLADRLWFGEPTKSAIGTSPARAMSSVRCRVAVPDAGRDCAVGRSPVAGSADHQARLNRLASLACIRRRACSSTSVTLSDGRNCTSDTLSEQRSPMKRSFGG